MGAIDVRLCEYLSKTEDIITFLMAVSTQADMKEDKKNLLTTDVTLGCFKAVKGIPSSEKGYVDLMVQNLGLPSTAVSLFSEATAAGKLCNRPTALSSLEKASSLSAQLRTQLENVHDSYRKQLLPPPAMAQRTSTVKMDEDLPSTAEEEEEPGGSPKKRSKIESKLSH